MADAVATNLQKARVLRHQTTEAERKLWTYLKGRQLAGIKFRRQYPIAGYIADFAAPEIRLIVELDGGQHLERGEYDARRTTFASNHVQWLLRAAFLER